MDFYFLEKKNQECEIKAMEKECYCTVVFFICFIERIVLRQDKHTRTCMEFEFETMVEHISQMSAFWLQQLLVSNIY